MRVCKKTGCQNPVKNPAMTYCSRDCAPYGNLGGEDTWFEDRMAKFSTKGAGEPSATFSKERLHSTYDGRKNTVIPDFVFGTSARVERTTEKISTMRENDIKNTGTTNPKPERMRGMPLVSTDCNKTLMASPNATPTNSSGMREETQLMDFIAPSPDTDKEKSPSPNLIDSTLVQLHGLMKSVNADPMTKNSPAAINAVCNVAKQMRELMSLKLSVVRTSRRVDPND